MEQQNVGSKRSASGTSGKIAAKSHDAAEQLKESVVGQANQMREKAGTAKAQTSDRIRGVATQLQNMSETLREDDPFTADLAQRASRGVENVAQYVRSSDARTLLRDTEQLARRQPALFFGGAFLLGLAAGRFLKSSAPQGSLERFDDSDEGGPLARPQERESGFFPSAERSVRSNRRFQENYDATFARGDNERNTTDRNTAEGDTLQRNPSERRADADDVSRRGEAERNGVEPSGRAAGRGERP